MAVINVYQTTSTLFIEYVYNVTSNDVILLSLGLYAGIVPGAMGEVLRE